MSAPRTIGIGILGFGTVGQGVWKHLHEKQADLESRLGVKLDLRKASVRDLKKKRAVKNPAYTALDNKPHGRLISLDYRVLKLKPGKLTRP